MDCKNGHGLKPEKVRPTFILCLQRILGMVLPGKIRLIPFFVFDNSKRAGILCMGDGAKECLQLRIDLKQQYPPHKAPLSLLLHSIKSPISSTNTVKFRK